MPGRSERPPRLVQLQDGLSSSASCTEAAENETLVKIELGAVKVPFEFRAGADGKGHLAMRLTVTSHVTLDGVVQSNGKPEPELNDGFDQGGWQVPYLDEEFAALMAGWIGAADAFLFGRGTYELFVGHWPKVTDPDDPLATRLKSKPKYIASTTLDNLDWHNSVLL
jgi:hypothetical protein